MKKVLMSAFIGSRNLGDEAIFKSILSGLDKQGLSITALSINEEKTKKHGVKTVFAKKIRNITRAIRECDVMMIGGGGIIQDQSSILNFLYYAFQIWYAQKKNKPVILCFVGVGPIKFSLSRWIMRHLAPSISYAIVRDEKSKKQLLSFGLAETRVHKAHDPVLNYPINKAKVSSSNGAKTPYVVVSLRRWFFTNPFLPVFISRNLNRIKVFRRRYESYMSNLARDLDVYLKENPDMHLVLVSLYDGEDDIVNADLVRLMSHKERVTVAATGMDEEEYLSIVKGSDFVLGMRLHSLILGSALGRSFFALRYSTKVDEFAEQMGLSHVSMQVDKYNSKTLLSGLKELTSSHEELDIKVRAKLTRYQRDNKVAFKLLNEQIRELS